MKTTAGLDQRIARSGLEKSLAELVHLRASKMNGCVFCIDVHTAGACKAGEREQRQATIAVWRETPLFNDRERAALAWTESVTRLADTRVPDDVWARMKPHFTPAELVDLTLLINTINAWNRFAIAFRKLPARGRAQWLRAGATGAASATHLHGIAHRHAARHTNPGRHSTVPAHRVVAAPAQHGFHLRAGVARSGDFEHDLGSDPQPQRLPCPG